MRKYTRLAATQHYPQDLAKSEFVEVFAPLYERLHRRAGELSAKLTEGVGSLFSPSVATLSRQLPPRNAGGAGVLCR